tara:strand:- start:428 stop:619 length:192 start_codon:yes stop_codon:yes gene_type:complete
MDLIFTILLAASCPAEIEKKDCKICNLLQSQENIIKIENNATHVYKKAPTTWIKVPKKSKISN